MTALVSPERATAASLTGAVGFLMLAIAVVMMVIAAPTQIHYGAHNPAKPSAVQQLEAALASSGKIPTTSTPVSMGVGAGTGVGSGDYTDLFKKNQ